MGNPKLKWTKEEEDALRRGVAKHGAGKWKHIHQDPEFGPALRSRSNIDLKDKWRNLGVASGLITRDKSKLKSKPKNAAGTTTVTPMIMSQSSKATDRAQIMDKDLSTRKQPSCLDRSAITDLKEIKNHAAIKTEEPTKKELLHRLQTLDLTTLAEGQAYLWAASIVAEAENMSSMAEESMREADRISAMAEESEAVLQFARNCLDSGMLVDVLLIA